MYAAEEKERRIKKEVNRLKKIYAKMDGDRMSLVIGTIQRAAFLRVSLEELEGDLNENGYTEPFQQGNQEPYLSTLASSGVAAVDSKADATQIKTDDYVPNAQLIDRTTQRFYNHFGTNAKIIQSAYNEDEWNAFYESTVEPILIDLGSEMTRKLFTRRERGCGNKIIFEASNLQYASMSTKLNLSAMVDRGAMTPNEWRAAMNKAPLPGGDVPLLRKDTATVVEPATTAGEEE